MGQITSTVIKTTAAPHLNLIYPIKENSGMNLSTSQYLLYENWKKSLKNVLDKMNNPDGHFKHQANAPVDEE
ncbi:MAG: hypothetical protein ACOYNC_00095 [Bacteroidales bacterium]